MLDAIVSFFQQLGEFFTTVWNLVKFAFGELVQFFKMVGSALSFIWSIINIIPTMRQAYSLPTIYLAFGICLILVLIIYIIVGRTAGGD